MVGPGAWGQALPRCPVPGVRPGLPRMRPRIVALLCPPLVPVQETALAEVLGDRVALANPLDYHTYIWGDEAAAPPDDCRDATGSGRPGDRDSGFSK